MIKPQIVNKLKSINELKLLTFLTEQDTWTHNVLTRINLASSLDIAEITLKVTLKSLLDKGLINKLSKGIYKINKDIIQ